MILALSLNYSTSRHTNYVYAIRFIRRLSVGKAAGGAGDVIVNGVAQREVVDKAHAE